MMHFTEHVLTEELVMAKGLLTQTLAILDAQAEDEAAYCVCRAIERLVRAPCTLDQWYPATGRNPHGSSPH